MFPHMNFQRVISGGELLIIELYLFIYMVVVSKCDSLPQSKDLVFARPWFLLRVLFTFLCFQTMASHTQCRFLFCMTNHSFLHCDWLKLKDDIIAYTIRMRLVPNPFLEKGMMHFGDCSFQATWLWGRPCWLNFKILNMWNINRKVCCLYLRYCINILQM